jgi:MoaA/NifB/PqqE/SkfB family radical SAM enzyme
MTVLTTSLPSSGPVGGLILDRPRFPSLPVVYPDRQRAARRRAPATAKPTVAKAQSKFRGWGTGILGTSKRYRRTVLKYLTVRKMWNAVKLVLQTYLRTETTTARPLVLRIEPTNVCNLECPGCITGVKRNPNPNGLMSLEDFKKNIDDSYKDTLLLRLDGMGEPLLNKHLPEMIGYAHRKGVGTAISANLNIASEATLRAVIEAGLDQIVVSCDGATQEVYEKYRVNGDVEMVFENLETLIRLKKEMNVSHPFVEFQYIKFDHNGHEIEAARERAEALGVDRFVTFKSGVADFPDFGKWGERDLSKSVLVRKENANFKSSCYWLYLTHTVLASGNVSTCCTGMAAKFSAGNAKEQGPNEIRNNSIFRFLRKMYKTQDRFVALDTELIEETGTALAEAKCMNCSRFPYEWKNVDDLSEADQQQIVQVGVSMN